MNVDQTVLDFKLSLNVNIEFNCENKEIDFLEDIRLCKDLEL